MILDKFLTDNDIRICVALGTISCFVTLRQDGEAIWIERLDGTTGALVVSGRTQEETYNKLRDVLPGATLIRKFKVPK